MNFDLEVFKQVARDYNEDNFEILEDNLETRSFYDILLQHGIIELTSQGQLKKRNHKAVYVGYLSIKPKFGFVLSDEDVYIHNTQGYLEGDIVVSILSDKQKGRSTEGRILDYVKRKDQSVLVEIKKDKNIIILDEKYKSYNVSLINKQDADMYNERQIVLLDIKDVRKKVLKCSFNKVVADANDPDLQMKITLATFGIETEFSQAALEELEQIKEVDVTDLESRVDLRDEIVMTIDGADSKDLDDAITLYKIGNDYRLMVSIADVSHYITEDSALDQDAYARSTSVYFVDRVVPMIPKKLSNGICSLHPNVDRLTLTCDMIIDSHGNIKSHKIYQSVINSKYRLTYDQVNDILEGRQVEGLEAITGTIFEMNKLKKALNKKRILRGSFNLEDKDAKFKVDEDGNIIDIVPYIRRDAEKLIEEFMILANECVATDIYEKQLPFLYRVHDKPNPKKLQEVLAVFSIMGIKSDVDAEDFEPIIFKQILDQLTDPISKRIASDLIVRSLSKARYHQKNTGHFGLASECYTHFTSPIRRYPDLVVHRNLRKYIINNNTKFSMLDEDKLSDVANQTSNKEVAAIKAEQQIEDQKKATYMKQFIGQEFEGVLASILEFGFFIELDNTVRGLIKFSSIKEFVKSANHKIHFSDKKIMTIGDIVQVKLIEVNETRGLVEFELVGYTTIKRSSSKVIRSTKKRKDGKKVEEPSKKRRRTNRKNKNYRNAKGKNKGRNR